MTILLTALVVATTPADSLCERAAYLFFNRHLAPGNLDSAYRLLGEVRRLAPDHQRGLYLWSRIHVQLGDLAGTKREKFSLYEKAKAIADTLKCLNPKNADGVMWWAVAQGRIGQTRGVLNSLFMVPTLKREFGRVLELDPKHPTAYDAFGVLYYELPGFAGGDLARSEEYLVRGLQIDPNYTLIRLDLAKTYIKQGRLDEARTQLNYVLSTGRPTYPADCLLDDQPEARELLAQLDRR
ncbi:MAG: tetratricopeptide repeat protein [candidate division WOR-3 bacterium]